MSRKTRLDHIICCTINTLSARLWLAEIAVHGHWGVGKWRLGSVTRAMPISRAGIASYTKIALKNVFVQQKEAK